MSVSRQEIHEKPTKNEGFQHAVTQVVLVKSLWNKKYTNVIFTLPSKLLIFIIDHAESCFFFLSLTCFFITATYKRFSNWPCTSRKTVCSHQNLFLLQNKRSNNPIWVGRQTKKQFKVVQVRFKDITCVR